jgi:phosphatidylinositol alpha-1,6-mannosyltransferase
MTLSVDAQALPNLTDKIRFGAALARRQLAGQVRWILFTHLRLARAEQFIPPPFRVPYAVFLHGVEAWDRLAPADVRAVKGASLRLANSRFTARRVMQANPDIGEVVACHLALPQGAADLFSGPVVRHARSKVVLVVGRIDSGERYKGHRQLIDIWPTVAERVPDAQLVIAGDGDDRPSLEAKARTVPHGDRILFTGFLDREALDAQYAQASIFALPSRGEGFGLVYLEAMANRLPCVGSIHDAATEVIVDGVTGLLADPDD